MAGTGGVSQTEFVNRLREQLYDGLAPYVWDAAVLQGALDQAVAEHSDLFPRPVRTTFNVAAGQQAFQVTPWLDPDNSSAPESVAPGHVDVITVTGVQCPAGHPLPEYDAFTTDPAQSRGLLWADGRGYSQAWRWRAPWLTLLRPAAGQEVGASTLVVEFTQTWPRPDDTTQTPVLWSGPGQDVALVLTLARRVAYQLLGEWWERNKFTTNFSGLPGGPTPAGNLPAIMAMLDREITRLIAQRRGRQVRSRALDV